MSYHQVLQKLIFTKTEPITKLLLIRASHSKMMRYTVSSASPRSTLRTLTFWRWFEKGPCPIRSQSNFLTRRLFTFVAESVNTCDAPVIIASLSLYHFIQVHLCDAGHSWTFPFIKILVIPKIGSGPVKIVSNPSIVGPFAISFSFILFWLGTQDRVTWYLIQVDSMDSSRNDAVMIYRLRNQNGRE